MSASSCRGALIPLALLTALCLAACKDGDAASPADAAWTSFDAQPAAAKASIAPLPRACALLTSDEAAVVLGQAVGQMADEPENCLWASSEHPARITMLMVQLVPSDDEAQAETMFGAMTGMSAQLNAGINEQMGERTRKSGQEIEGLGDAAWRSTSNADLIATEQLVIRKGTVLLQFNITGMTRDGKVKAVGERLEKAARVALERMS